MLTTIKHPFNNLSLFFTLLDPDYLRIEYIQWKNDKNTI